MDDTTAAGLPTPSRCLECESRENFPGTAGYCKRMKPFTALLAYEVMNHHPGFCPLTSKKPRVLPADDLPRRCLECACCEAITSTTYLCTQREPPLALLPREVHQNRPTFCPRELDYRQGSEHKKAPVRAGATQKAHK